MTPAPDLFTPYQLGPLTLPNRILMAPMTRSRAGEGNVPGPLAAEYYSQRASAGLIITEATQVSQQGIGYIHTPGIHSAAQVDGWRRVTDAVHTAGGRIYLQLWHVGRVSHPDFHNGELPVAPSALGFEGKAFTLQGLKSVVTPRALTTQEVHQVVTAYRQGAANAKAAGFDGVEIHGANGYLPEQFLVDGSNHRTDEYGGSVQNRARFLLQITQAAVDVWDPARVGVRLSPSNTGSGSHDSNRAATYGYVMEQLNNLPLAYLHAMEAFTEPKHGDGLIRPVVDFARSHYKGTLVINAGFDYEKGQAVVQSGKADLVSYGVLFLANPDLPARFHAHAALNSADKATFYGGTEKGYTDYPALN